MDGYIEDEGNTHLEERLEITGLGIGVTRIQFHLRGAKQKPPIYTYIMENDGQVELINTDKLSRSVLLPETAGGGHSLLTQHFIIIILSGVRNKVVKRPAIHKGRGQARRLVCTKEQRGLRQRNDITTRGLDNGQDNSSIESS